VDKFSGDIKVSTTAVIQRIKKKLDIKTDKKLTEMLGVKATTFSAWRTRNSLDFKLVLEFCRENDLDLNHIFFGEKDELVNREEIYISELLKAITARVMSNVSEEVSSLKATQQKILALLVKEEIQSEIKRAKHMPLAKSRNF